MSNNFQVRTNTKNPNFLLKICFAVKLKIKLEISTKTYQFQVLSSWNDYWCNATKIISKTYLGFLNAEGIPKIFPKKYEFTKLHISTRQTSSKDKYTHADTARLVVKRRENRDMNAPSKTRVFFLNNCMGLSRLYKKIMS